MLSLRELINLIESEPKDTSGFEVLQFSRNQLEENYDLIWAITWPFTFEKTHGFNPWECVDCKKCQLGDNGRVVISGNLDAKYLFVGVAPSATKRLSSSSPVFSLAWQFGPSSGLLKAVLIDLGLYFDCAFTNLLKCPLPGNREPTVPELEACSQFLMSEIQQVKPEKIFAMGRVVHACLPDAIYLVHPSYFARQPESFSLLRSEVQRKVGSP